MLSVRRHVSIMPTAELPCPHRFTLRSFAGNQNGMVVFRLLDGPMLRNAVAYLAALTLAGMPCDAETSAGLRDDNNNLARVLGRISQAEASADAGQFVTMNPRVANTRFGLMRGSRCAGNFRSFRSTDMLSVRS